MGESMNAFDEFAIPLGAIVRFKIIPPRTEKFSVVPDCRGIVTGRLLEQCSGGVQRHYVVSMATLDGVKGWVMATHRVHELELELDAPADDPKP